MFVRKGLFLGIGALGATGACVYWMMPSSSYNKNHKHMKVFERLKKTYSGRALRRDFKSGMRLEIIDSNDPLWNQKWEEYKSKSSDFPSVDGKAKESLEEFQEVCYSEIERKGMNLEDAAKYSTDSGRLNESIGPSHLSYDEVKDKKFVWELCLKISAVLG